MFINNININNSYLKNRKQYTNHSQLKTINNYSKINGENIYRNLNVSFGSKENNNKSFIDTLTSLPIIGSILNAINKIIGGKKDEKIKNLEQINKFINLLELIVLRDGDLTHRFKDFTRELSQMYNHDGLPVYNSFEGSYIAGLAKLITIANKDNLPLIKELAKVETKDGKPRFNSNDISKIINLANESNESLIKEMIQMETEAGAPRFNCDDIARIIQFADKNNISLIREFVQMKTKDGKPRFFSGLEIAFIFSKSETNIPLIKKLAKMETQNGIPIFSVLAIIEILSLKNEKNINFIQQTSEIAEKLTLQFELMLSEPEKYVSGDYKSLEESQEVIKDFYNHNSCGLWLAASVLDKESLNNLMRMRLQNSEIYLDTLQMMNELEFSMLKKLCDSKNIDGKEFCGNQKIELIDLVMAYSDNNLSFLKMKKMIEDGKVDIEELNGNLLIKIMKNLGLSNKEIESIPNERFKQWDLKLIYLLSKEINDSEEELFKDIFRLGNFSDNFKKSIHDISTPYGQANTETRTMFETLDMDYEKWVSPSKENEIRFIVKDKNLEQLSQISEQLLEDIETLRKSPFIKKHIDANFQKCLKNGEFVIPQHILSNKEQLLVLTNFLIEKLDKFWTMAQNNLEKPNLAQRARNTLTILDHLKQRLKDIEQVHTNTNATKQIDLTIKMWDRNPQKDIFQGNYSTCCIGLGNGNGSAMPHYLMNTSYNMIELVDNTTGKTIGNALCFFVKGEDDKPVFIIDNIEINNAHKTSKEVGVQLRNAIAEYASKVAREVIGNDHTPIYVGHSYNDVPTADLQSSSQKVEFLGDVGIHNDDEIYMDLYGGWVNKSELSQTMSMLRLK